MLFKALIMKKLKDESHRWFLKIRFRWSASSTIFHLTSLGYFGTAIRCWAPASPRHWERYVNFIYLHKTQGTGWTSCSPGVYGLEIEVHSKFTYNKTVMWWWETGRHEQSSATEITLEQRINVPDCVLRGGCSESLRLKLRRKVWEVTRRWQGRGGRE